nr:hypothetical protein [Arthrobacter sp. ISL-65]
MRESTPIPQDFAGGAEYQSKGVDQGQKDCEGGEIDVGGMCLGQDGLAGDEDGREEQDREEGIAAKNITERQLVVALFH